MNLTDMTNVYNDVYDRFGVVRNCTIICCADHGVAEENVSAYPQTTTAQMVKNYLISGGAAANAFAGFAHSELIVVDVGVNADISDLPDLVNRKIAKGTKNITKGSAMTLDQAMRSIEIGIDVVKTAFEAGYNCFLPGEMGIANTTSSAAIVSALLKVPPEEVTGRGTNISDERFAHKIEVVKKALEVNKKKYFYKRDPKRKAMEVLAALGGFEIGCIAGVIIAAWKADALVIIDGFNSAAAALIACSLVPECRKNIIASQAAREQGQKYVLAALSLEPMLNLDLALGEAIGSSIAAQILSKMNDSFNGSDYDDYEEDHDDEDDYDDDEEEAFDFDFDFDDDDDDEDYDVEVNIYDGTGDQRFNAADDDDYFSVEFKEMSEENISVTDRTFNFYLNTMPRLDKYSMERCKNHIDNLSKPYGSLGLLEEIAIQIAGMSNDELPNSNLNINLICFTDKVDEAEEFRDQYENDEELDDDSPLIDIYDTAEAFDVDLTVAIINKGEDTNTVFDFGRMTAEDLSFKVPILGISIINDVEKLEDIGMEFEEHLLTKDLKLKYKADDFLRHVPKHRRNLVSAVIGAIIAAAHNSSLVIVDTGAVDIIARYIEQLCPDVQPYILHASKLIINDSEGCDDELDGEAVCVAAEVVRAALHALNEMKTFSDTGVDTAIDGLGSIHQH